MTLCSVSKLVSKILKIHLIEMSTVGGMFRYTMQWHPLTDREMTTTRAGSVWYSARPAYPTPSALSRSWQSLAECRVALMMRYPNVASP